MTEIIVPFLDIHGNDYDGNVGLEFGILGLPETLLTNKQGKIIFKHIGPLTKEIIKNNIIPFLINT